MTIMTSPFSRKATRRNATAVAPMVLCAFSVMCVLVVAGLAGTPVSAAAAAPMGFRCQRPFSAMDRLGDVAKAHPAQNCDYFYFTVQSAAATLQCASSSSSSSSSSTTTGAGGGDDDDTTCNVTVRWSMRRAPRVAALLQRQVGTDADYFTQDTAAAATAAAGDGSARAAVQRAPAASALPPSVTEDDDVWRFAISLKAKGDSTVQYKGFNDGDGYSLCCDALTDSTCVWMTAQQGDNDIDCDEEVEEAALRHSRALRSCPLPHPVPRPEASTLDGDDVASFGAPPGVRVALTDLDDEDGEEEEEEGGSISSGSGVFHGQITKPLHRLVEGPWEVAIQFWRRRQRLPAHMRAGNTDGSTPPISTGTRSTPTDQSIEAEVLGRLVVPFTLDLAQLRKEGRVARVPGRALAVEGEVAEVARNAAAAAPSHDADAATDL